MTTPQKFGPYDHQRIFTSSLIPDKKFVLIRDWFQLTNFFNLSPKLVISAVSRYFLYIFDKILRLFMANFTLHFLRFTPDLN